MSDFDIKWVRKQFPALQKMHDGKPAVYFDGPGGTQVPAQVATAVTNYLLNSNANTGGLFETSEASDSLLEDAHQAMADFLGAAPDEISFGANMTTMTFALSRAIARNLRRGDEIIVTRLDHDANVAPWLALAERGIKVKFIDFHTADCTLNLEQLKKAVNSRTRVIAAGYASNAVGTINDVKSIVKIAREAGAISFIDAVHYAPHGPIDVHELDVDFLACSVYKFFGTHVGALFGKRVLLKALEPFKVRPATNKLPGRWETGTLNHEGIAGALAAIDYLAEVGRRTGKTGGSKREQLVQAMSAIKTYEQTLSIALLQRLKEIPGVKLYGLTDETRVAQRTPTVGITIDRVAPADAARLLGGKGIYVWDGNFYALGVTESLGLENAGGLIRIGLVHYNTIEEIDALALALKEVSRAVVQS